jgi:enterochelin esterase-like enzyme
MSRLAAASRLARKWPAATAAVVAVAVAGAVAGLTFVSGTIDSSNTTLMFMGFDADRAQLITALLIAGVAAAAVSFATNRIGHATLAGMAGLAALFGYTFAHQTRQATKATGINGSFDPGGWVLTLLALVMVGLISSWAGATLARALRPGLIAAGAAARDTFKSRSLDWRLLRRPLVVVVVTALLVVSMPVFGDMVNYTTDSRMLHGGPPPVGLIPGAAAQAGVTLAPGEKPWLAWQPSGSGAIVSADLPAPWQGGSAMTENIGIYTPPGYDPKGSRRYPVLYEAPFDVTLWDSSINFKVALDTLIDTGAVPPMIAVFVNAYRAPIGDTECANSSDGKQWFDTFISQTVVSYVDSNYLTIARGDARAFTGFSEGGYCAAIEPLRHPAVFGTAIPMSGYFWAGEGDANSKDPFVGDASALIQASPMVLATELSAADRDKLFFVVVAKPAQPVFGFQATEFEHLLQIEGYHYVALDSDLPHGWEQVRQAFPPALEAWATHLVAAKVF